MRCHAGLVAFVLLAVAVPGPASAQHAREHVRAGRVQPLDEILPHIRNSRPGTFYDAEGPFRGSDGRMHYRLKWMTPGGRIIWLDTDAASGRVLGESGGPRAPAWEHGVDIDRRYAPRNNLSGRGDEDWRERRGQEWRQREQDRSPDWRDREDNEPYDRGRGGYDRGRDYGRHERGGRDYGARSGRRRDYGGRGGREHGGHERSGRPHRR